MRVPLLMIILSYLILLITDFVIIRDLYNFSLYSKYGPVKKEKRRWWKIYLIFSILVLLILTVGICMPKREGDTDITALMWLLYIVVTVVSSQIFYLLFSLLGSIPMLFGKKRWNTGLWVGLPVGVLVFTMMWVGTALGRRNIQVVDVEIDSKKVPQGFDGYKIAQISDLHLGTWGQDTTFVSKLVDRINDLKPDLIVFTGDAVNRKAEEFKPFIPVLSRLSAPDGVLTILGNHDYGDYISWKSPEEKKANLDSLISYQQQAGWKLLNNRHTAITRLESDSIVLIGVGNWGEPPFTKYGNLQKSYPADSLYDGKFKILLSHNPEHWKREVTHISNIDLTLSGHTHAMQIIFSFGKWRWSPSKLRYDLWGGLYSTELNEGENSRVYVNIGAGEVGMPMRIGADPEITLFTLKSEK